MSRNTRWFVPSMFAAFSVLALSGVAVAEPAAPTQAASPAAEASRHLRAAYQEVSAGLTPAGAKRGLAAATARIQRGYRQLLSEVHGPTPMR